MNKASLLSLVKTVRRVAVKHAPEILTGIGIAGMVTTTVLAVQATPKAMKLKERATTKKGAPLTVKETVKTCWKPYAPAAATGLASIGCLIGGTSVGLRRNAALVSAYKLSENALTEYRDKVVETVGEKQEKTIRDAVVKDKITGVHPKDPGIIRTGFGNTLFYDSYCGRLFESDRNEIDRIINVLNRRMRTEMYISLNEYYRDMGLYETEIGDYIGWNIDKGYIELDYGSDLVNGETPCVTLHYVVKPLYDYDKF